MGKMTARLGAEMIGAMEGVGADRLVDPSGAQMLYEKVASSDKKLIVYEGFFHEVFNEPEHDRVLSDVEQWLGGVFSYPEVAFQCPHVRFPGFPQ